MSEQPARIPPAAIASTPQHPQHALSRPGTLKAGEGERPKLTLGFLGGGMMASALIKGLVKAEVLPNFAIFVSDPYKPSRDKLVAEVGVTGCDTNIEVAEVGRGGGRTEGRKDGRTEGGNEGRMKEREEDATRPLTRAHWRPVI